VKANELLRHFQSVGPWVDWKTTCDVFQHGDPDAEVRGLACAWITTNAALREAAARGANVFITHEPPFFPGYANREFKDTPALVEALRRKRALMDELGLTVLRCHDTWDRMPEIGIPDSWAKALGFPIVKRDAVGFFRILDVSGRTVDSLAREILPRVRPWGQDTVLILGDGAKPVARLGIGTGAIIRLPYLRDVGADVILATDDGMNSWDGGQWATDMGVPLLVVNHAVAEFPGMKALADYLRGKFPDVPCCYLPVDIPFRSVH
jgi:putative NIF3 family GTP cyclohydrolase 1 type 2